MRPWSFSAIVLRAVMGISILAMATAAPRAAEIFRGSASASAGTNAGTSSTLAGGTAAAPVSLGQQQSLQRAATVMQAVQAMQAAARAAAAALSGPMNLGANPNQAGQTLPNVPDGLASPQVPGTGTAAGPGLRVAVDANGNPVLWQGAGAPRPAAGNPNQITITQTQQQALLQWQTFDIGKNTTLTFDQSAGAGNVGQWIAFNFVRDPSGRPSQILGALTTTNGLVDAQGNPEAGGQVYVINANGIIFGGSSQVNAGALVASSLPINTNLIQRGLLNNPDEQFLFSELPIAAGSNGPTPAFDPSVAVSGVAPAQTPFAGDGSGAAGSQYGDVTVQTGATLTSPSSAGSVGGKIMLVGPNVTNDGTLSAPDGQAIIAAGLQVGAAAHASGDASLRGLDIYIGAVANPSLTNPPAAGTATNDVNGLIVVPLGDVTIAGAAVNQFGVISSGTSVSYNGRIDLLAGYNAVSSGGAANEPPFFWQATGPVVLGSASLTEIMPELSDATTIAGTTLTLPSQVNIQGASVQLDGASGSMPGSTLLAPNATVTVDAGTWEFVNGGVNSTSGLVSTGSAEQFIYDSGQITLQDGAALDVSGSENVSASVTEDIVSVPLTGTELADSPLQRNGPLRGQTIQIDIRDTGTYDGEPWVGTPLADTTGYVGLIQRTVGELTTDGGSVALNAGGAVVLQNGSSINVSGGWINYQGGNIQTTKLITGDGEVIDISQATPDQVYAGIYTGASSTTDPKWGVTNTTSNPVSTTTYAPGYVQGGNAGSITIKAPAMALGGTLAGFSYPGSGQTNPFVPYTSSSLQGVIAAGIDPRVWELDNQPMSGTLDLVFEGQYAVSGSSNTYDWYLPAPPDIYFQSSGTAAPADPRALVLSTGLVTPTATDYSGFGHLTIDDSADSNQLNSTGAIVVGSTANQPFPALYGTIDVEANPTDPNNIALQTTPGGSIVLDAGNINIGGGMIVPGGQISFTAHDFWENSPYDIANEGIPTYDPGRGNLSIAAGVTLSSAGLITDERIVSGNSADTPPTQAQGGTIALAGSNVTLGPQSVLNVDGGAMIAATGAVTYGAAGSLTLKAGADPAFNEILGGSLNFNAADEVNLAPNLEPLEGYSGSAGGALTLGAPLVQVGTVAGASFQPGTLQLSPDFFNQGGFSAFTLDGIGRVETDANGNALTDAAGDALYYPAVDVASGAQIHPRVQALEIVLGSSGYQSEINAPLAYQETPVSIALNATGALDPSKEAGVTALLTRGDLLVGAGALVESDPENNAAQGVTLSGNTVTVLGSIVAPGGTIAITGGADSTKLFATGQTALPTVDLGPRSDLSTAGTTVLTSDYRGLNPGDSGYLTTGSVLAGGSISVSGNVVAEAGAQLDVAGWSDANDPSGLLNLSASLSGGSLGFATAPLGQRVVPTVIASNGGSITFKGGQELFVDATLDGAAGGPTAVGGSLSISSEGFELLTPLDADLQVTQSGPTIPAPFYGPNQTAIGNAVVDTAGNPLAGMGYFAADSFASGGFASLVLGGAVQFEGPVTIAATDSLTVGTTGVIYANGPVNLSAGYVALGQAYVPPVLPAEEITPFGSYNPSPTYGAGTLTVSAGNAGAAGLIDIGNLSLQTIGQAALTAAGGGIRGFGTLDIAGDLTLTAGQVYAPTEESFTLAAYNYNLPTDPSGAPAHPSSVTFIASGAPQIPLSAGSTLSVYASVINQGGNLQAPIGTINLGWDGSGTAPIDPITNAAVPMTQQLTLGQGSTTSVSAAMTDPVTGQALSIPYGLVLNGISWIDPSGNDITNGGLPAKSVNLSATAVNVSAGSVIDTAGGGDLYSYQFIPGTGGTNDILTATSGRFAVIPGYQAAYAPDAAFNSEASTTSATNYASGDLGYTSVGGSGQSLLSVGDQVHLDLNNGLGPQNYTLLPARYALLPGAYLVTPMGVGAAKAVQTVAQPDGSLVVSGYRINAFDPSQPLSAEFEVESSSVVQNQAQYTVYSANTFYGANGQSSGSGTVRLPVDSGQLDIFATGTLALLGSVVAAPGTGGRDGLVDISSPENIVINDSGTGSAAGTMYLGSDELSGLDAGSLLIGGTSSVGTAVTLVNVTAGNLIVDNDAADPLTGSDIVLVANQSLTLGTGADLQAVGTLSGPSDPLIVSDSLQLQPASGGFVNLARGGTAVSFPNGTPTGDTIESSVGGTVTVASGATQTLVANKATTLAVGSTVTLSGAGKITAGGTGGPIPVTLGDGLLVRVSTDASAQSSRTGVASSTAPILQIGQGATLTGASVTLDSTNSTVLDPSAILTGAVSISSGQVSIVLDSSLANSVPSTSLALTGGTLATLQTGATALTLLSYSSIDTYGSGQIGNPNFTSLVLNAPEIRGFQTGTNGDVTLSSQTITLENSLGGAGPGPTTGMTPSGTFSLNAGVINFGANNVAIDQFANVNFTASGGVLAQGAGSLATPGNLTVTTPLLTAAGGASHTITAGGNLAIGTPATGTATVSGGLGGSLTLVGSTVTENGSISLPSGSLTLHATGASGSGGNLTVAGTLNAGGTMQTFANAIDYTDAGEIELVSDYGNVELEPGAYVDVAAQPGGGNAGTLSVSAANGMFTISSGTVGAPGQNGSPIPTLDGRNGEGGIFSLDASNLSDAHAVATGSLGYLESALAAGGFSQSQTIRVRTGDVAVDGTIKAGTFNLSTDRGSIDVTGTGLIDASGVVGGTIELDAAGSVTLEGGAQLSVLGQNFNDAGQGGSVTLQAGAYTGGAPVSPTGARGSNGLFGADATVVDIMSGSTIDLTVVNDHPLELDPAGAGSIAAPANVGIFFPNGTPGSDEIALGGSGSITTSAGISTPFTATVLKPFVTTLTPGSTVILSGGGLVAFAGGSGGSIPLSLPYLAADGTPFNLAASNVTDLAAYNASGVLQLIAPQVVDSNGNPYDVEIDPVAGAIRGLDPGSSIVLEGTNVFDLASTNGVIDATVQASVENNGANFAGGLQLNDDGSITAVAGNTPAMLNSVLAGNSALAAFLQANPNSVRVRPGAEIVNPDGNLTLASTWDFTTGAFYNGGDPSVPDNWDLSGMQFRFGPALDEPGYLTLRASGNVVFGMDPNTGQPVSLNDAFAGYDGSDNSTLWQAVLLPAGSQSWSFQLVAGADLSAADSRDVLPASALAAGSGSLLLGVGIPALALAPSSTHDNDDTLVPNNYQTIRTGTGSIGIYAGGNVELLNNLATIYTAGTQTAPLANFSLAPTNFPPEYTYGGGDLTMMAQGNIEHLTTAGAADSSKEMPTDWLYRSGWIAPNGQFGSPAGSTTDIDSTSWWIDFSNFFEGVGALGGGNVSLVAGGNVSNVDAVVPTDERTTSQTTLVSASGSTLDQAAADQTTLELGGGDLQVQAGQDIDGGVYYVERGQGALAAGRSIHTNQTRLALGQTSSAAPTVASNPIAWLPTTLFLGQGSLTVDAVGDVLLGPVANPFLLPQGSGNGILEKTYFSTFATSDVVDVASLAGTVTLKESGDQDAGGVGGSGSLADWYNLVLSPTTTVSFADHSQPWLSVEENNISPFAPVMDLLPSSLAVTAFAGDINIVGSMTLSPAPGGEVSLLAEGAINGFQPNSVQSLNLQTSVVEWGSGLINLSESNPASIPGVLTPLSLNFLATTSAGFKAWQSTASATLGAFGDLFDESGSTTGIYGVLQTQQALNDPGLLHASDPVPVELYATTGDISGLTLFAGKTTDVVAGRDVTDIALYLQNDAATDISEIVAGRNLTAYDPSSLLREQAQAPGNGFVLTPPTATPATGSATAGDIQIGGPGTLEVLTGGNIDLGVGPESANGTSVGITSIGNSRDPYLPFGGANIVTAAGITGLSTAADATPSLAVSGADFSDFIQQYVDPATAGANAARYLPEVAAMLGVTVSPDSTPQQVLSTLLAPSADLSPAGQSEQEDLLALDVFYLVLRDTGRDFNSPASPYSGSYAEGYAAIQTLFPGSQLTSGNPSGPWQGNISLTTRLIETTNGGNVDVLAPGGQITVGLPTDPQKPDQGILTEDGGDVSIYARDSANVGTSRIFTLHGGNVVVWSTLGSIAAGSGSRTVHAAPPTRVLIDPQSADVQNDLAGLATGSGIGVLATLVDVAPGAVDLIAPVGTIDAGDAGIRSSGTINVAALHVENASNIQAAGATTGVPIVAAPNIGGLTSASGASAAAASAAQEVATRQQASAQPQEIFPSIIDVEVIGYGGDEADS